MLEEINLSMQEVKKICKLYSENSLGDDNVHLAVLKNLGGLAAQPLSYTFKKSLEIGRVP